MREIRLEAFVEIEAWLDSCHDRQPMLRLTTYADPNGINIPLTDLQVSFGGDENDDERPAARLFVAALRKLADEHDPDMETTQ